MLLLMGVGFASFFAGFATLFGLLISRGALAKSRQFAAMGDISSGRQGGGSQILLVVAVLLMAVGACGLFAGVAVGDVGRKNGCKDTCIERGYRTGKVQGSKARDPNRPNVHAFVACVCSGGASPDLELDSRDIE
jgi:hypothetical protein